MSSMTQYAGTSSGARFDPRNGKNMEPLLGEAFVKTLQFMEEQFVYGAENEYEGSFKDVNLDMINQGKCAMTYMWGDSFKEAAKSPPVSYVSGYLGTAYTPGSRVYLDRDTQKLLPCTEDICTCGNANFEGHEDDTDCINSAPYAAFTGWTGACSNFTSSSQKRACAEFFGYVSSPATSVEDTIPNMADGAEVIAVDPYRTSQTHLSDWVERGLPENSTRSFLTTIKSQLSSPNVVLDMRIPAAAEFQAAMNAVFRDHLTTIKKKRDAGMVGEELLSTDAERWKAENDIRNRWKEIITHYDQTHPAPLLESYQKNLGVYNPEDTSSSSIGVGPIIGIVAVIVAVIAVAVAFVVREKNRKDDQIWKIKESEIKMEDPPVVVGRGRFGLVLLAEYRGTEVAVKRVIPSSDPKKKGSTGSGDTDSMAACAEAAAACADAVGACAHPSVDAWLKHSVCVDVESPLAHSGSTEATPDFPALGANSARSNPRRTSLKMGSKTLALNKASRRELKKDFVREMRLLSKLRHPCITTAIGAVINSKDEPMLVMEYMHHGSLHDILHNETMILEGCMLLQLLRDITQGVRFLHACDPEVIHCDLKASNILVDSRFRAKVADFGLSSKALSRASGTPFWMAPELLRGTSGNTVASDVYAFGIILYEVFSRKDPYDGENPLEVLRLVCDPSVNKRPPAPKDCPPQIHSIMSDCLVYDPEERPTFEELDKRMKRVDVKIVESTQVQTKQPKESMSLDDIFPKHIADALREGRDVKPEHREMVTIFFSDIVGFTKISETLEPGKVAKMLGRLYDKLDILSRKHEVFKVETIGDAYMAVTNLVNEQPDDHVKRIAQFAIDALAAANSTNIDMDNPERGCLNIRVGFHSGPVVADVVGSVNARYCLFGDAVNTSSRMESHSEKNRIQCTEAAANLLRIQDPSIPLTPRGKIPVKGKGLMNTYWVGDYKATAMAGEATAMADKATTIEV